MLPVLNRSSVSTSCCDLAAKSYGITVVIAKMPSANPRLPMPSGALAPTAVSISPRPWRKSVSTLAWFCSNDSSWLPTYVACTLLTAIGCIRPDAGVVGAVPHELDRLAHGLADLGRLERGVEEQPAAERAAALHDVDLHLVLRQAAAPAAIAAWAAIGVLSADQTSARSLRTSATAALVSSAELLRK